MKVLLDTRVWLWLLTAPERLGAQRPLVDDPNTTLLVAQAQLLGIPLVTADPALGEYEVDLLPVD